MTDNGYLALVLHAHLPFVRHPEYPEFLEEDWLYEAITETYLPLLAMFDRLAGDGVPFALTLTMTPPLCAMLRDPLLGERYLRYLDRAITLAERETVRTRHGGRSEDTAWFYVERLRDSRRQYLERWRGDLVAAFRWFQDAGYLEIITCGATHGLLPLMENIPQAVRAQVFIARDEYRACFGRDPAGIWLPECAYIGGIDQILQEANIRWFILDAHGLMYGQPRPRRAIYAPCYTPAGPAAFSRDRESSRQVWSAQHGYPGDPAYRDFYRDIGFELPLDQLAPVIGPEGPRKFTGFKYHRITGRARGEGLVPPRVGPGRRRLARGAFHERAPQPDRESAPRAGRGPHRGGALRRGVVRPLVVRGAGIFGTVLAEGGLRSGDFQADDAGAVFGHASDAADGGAVGVELGAERLLGSVAAPEQFVDLSALANRRQTHGGGGARRVGGHRFSDARNRGRCGTRAVRERLLKQMARELLLAQSSDWAFLMKTGTATPLRGQADEGPCFAFYAVVRAVAQRRVGHAFP